MKRGILVLAITLLTICLINAQKVYITKTGTKFHTASCRYASAGWEVDLATAIAKGLSPCSVCKPSTAQTSTTPTEAPKNAQELNSSNAQKVYITKTGTKYHTASCRYASVGWEVDLATAIAKGLSPCSVCNPSTAKTTNTLTEAPKNNLQSSPSTYNTEPKQTTSRQCSGITQSGARCKRMTTDPSGRCYQHK